REAGGAVVGEELAVVPPVGPALEELAPAEPGEAAEREAPEREAPARAELARVDPAPAELARVDPAPAEPEPAAPEPENPAPEGPAPQGLAGPLAAGNQRKPVLVLPAAKAHLRRAAGCPAQCSGMARCWPAVHRGLASRELAARGRAYLWSPTGMSNRPPR